MYVRRNRKKNKDGSERVEVMLAHNVRVKNSGGDPVTKPVVMARLGREEALDGDMVDSMIAALERYRDKRRRELDEEGVCETPVEEAEAIRQHVKPRAPAFRVLASKQLGVRLVVERVWKELGLQDLFQQLERAHCRKVQLERVVFAMVVNRLVDPVAKLACNDWVEDLGYFPEVGEGWGVDHFYRALDVIEANLSDISDHIARTTLDGRPEAERGPLLMDTTAVFTEAAMDDVQRAEIEGWWQEYVQGKTAQRPVDPRPQVVNDPPLRMRGKSKDGRPDAPQVVVGLVTTVSGRLVSHSVQPGNTSDKVMTREMVAKAMQRHPDQEVTWVMDSGMAGKKNLRWLAEQEGRCGWLCGVPVRRSSLVADLLRRPGRWKQLGRKAPEGPWTYRCLDVPEDERIDPNRPERLIAVRNPRRARRDKRKLEDELRKVKALIAKDPSPPPKGVKARQLSTPSRSRLTKWSNSKLTLDKDAVALERRLAGVKVLRTVLMDTPVSQVVEGYDDLLKVESDFRTFKSPLRVRPMYHRSSHRIRAHVMVCFISLMCQQEIERRAGMTWKQLRKGLDEIHAVEMGHGNDRWWQHSELSSRAWEALQACGVVSMEPRWVTSDMPRTKWAS